MHTFVFNADALAAFTNIVVCPICEVCAQLSVWPREVITFPVHLVTNTITPAITSERASDVLHNADIHVAISVQTTFGANVVGHATPWHQGATVLQAP